MYDIKEAKYFVQIFPQFTEMQIEVKKKIAVEPKRMKKKTSWIEKGNNWSKMRDIFCIDD